MPVFAIGDARPRIDASAFIAPTACIIGDVEIEADVSVWYGTVLRGDAAPVVVKAGANLQDGAVLHGAPGTVTTIGERASVAHNCVVHGAHIGEEAVVGLYHHAPGEYW